MPSFANLESYWNELFPRLLAAMPATLAIIVGAVLLRMISARLLLLLADNTSMSKEMVTPFIRLMRGTITVVALILILGVFGFNLGGLWTLLATILGMIAIGFVAVWSLLSNMSATVIILMTQPFQVGDDVEIAGDPVKGRVIDLNFFFTTLLDEDGRLIQVPNNLFFQKTLKRRRNGATVSLAFQLNSATPAALPPPPVSERSDSPKSSDSTPNLSAPDPETLSPATTRGGR